MNCRMRLHSLKYFFGDSFTTEDGEEMSSREIRRILKEHIDSENKKKPLTDEETIEWNKVVERFDAVCKEAYIKEVANKWKDQIDIRVYDALMTYVVEMKEHGIIVEQFVDTDNQLYYIYRTN